VDKKIEITIIGSGNVAEHLLSALVDCDDVNVIQLYSRNIHIGRKLSTKFGVNFATNISELKHADLYLISVTDTAIAEVSSLLPFENKLVAHTSGATDISAISNQNRRGVFYPLQSFSKGKKIDFSQVPICLEAENTDDLNVLKLVAHAISNTVNEISSEQRKYLHISAVFVNNFVNHMFYIGKEIADYHKVDFDLLIPLINETVNKLKHKTPNEAQTGPAIRNDISTMKKHLDLIPTELHKSIYKLISDSIFRAKK
jgi:predicted short-subunit dehydrogenase-like oxidoreductase (DUF2520 family)